ncbi:MAG: Uncharacterized protein XE02_1675, partial [Mesotoga infera]
ILEQRLDVFSKYLTVWVGVAMFLGAILGNILPGLSNSLGNWQIANVSIPVAIVLLFMMYPIMLKIEFKEIVNVKKNSRPLLVTLVVNWAIKPFTMAFISWLFMRIFFNPIIPDGLANEYVAGMVLLGLAPCTAMVLVWTYLAKGNINYALVQVAINDLIILFLFAPMGKLLIGVSTGFPVPFSTIFWSVVFYVADPCTSIHVPGQDDYRQSPPHTSNSRPSLDSDLSNLFHWILCSEKAKDRLCRGRTIDVYRRVEFL